MSKVYIIIALVLLVLVLAGGGYYYWKTNMQKSTVTNVVNSIENTQVVNPYDKTNPFSNIKVNPFE